MESLSRDLQKLSVSSSDAKVLLPVNKKTGLKRDTIDKFYTKENIVKECISNIQNHINISKRDVLLEPSAGNGRFLTQLKQKFPFCKIIGIDISPDIEEIQKQDFLTYSNNHENKNVHVIGNPPFGKQSSMAKQFIKKSCKFAKTICFILPKSFKKQSVQEQSFDKYFHLIYSKDLPENSFTIDDRECNVPCVFQIWIKKTTMRPVCEKIIENGYIFTKRNEAPDFSLRRVGVYAGKLSKDIVDKSVESHYFIKITGLEISKDVFFEKYNNEALYDRDNTVGPRSISKEEVKHVLNNIIENISK
jgi:predicted RNA methylase